MLIHLNGIVTFLLSRPSDIKSNSPATKLPIEKNMLISLMIVSKTRVIVEFIPALNATPNNLNITFLMAVNMGFKKPLTKTGLNLFLSQLVTIFLDHVLIGAIVTRQETSKGPKNARRRASIVAEKIHRGIDQYPVGSTFMTGLFAQ